MTPLITPDAYFEANPDACLDARYFCRDYPTMRDAWLSPAVDVDHMLWALGQNDANHDRLVEFAKWCATRAREVARGVGTDDADYYAEEAEGDAESAGDNDNEIGEVLSSSIDAADDFTNVCAEIDEPSDGSDPVEDSRKEQRLKLRELFPTMFTSEPEPKVEGITPRAYFRLYENACDESREFCLGFNTMREAWLSDEAYVDHMLWGLGRDTANSPALVTFIQWCADEARAEAERLGLPSADRYAKVAEVSFSEATAELLDDPTHTWGLASNAADSHASVYESTDEAAARQRQRDKLRELFPNMLVTAPEGPTE